MTGTTTGFFGGLIRYAAEGVGEGGAFGNFVGTGTGIGTAAGISLGVCCAGGISLCRYFFSHENENEPDEIAESEEFEEWQEGEIKELYDLLVNFAKRALTPEQIREITDHDFLPSIPVKPPVRPWRGPNLHYVYEKEEAYARLDEIQRVIGMFGGNSEGRFRDVFPEGEVPFNKGDLKYALVFAKEVVSNLVLFKEGLDSNLEAYLRVQQYTNTGSMTALNQTIQKEAGKIRYARGSFHVERRQRQTARSKMR